MDGNFDAGDVVTQVRLLKMCEVLSNRTDLATSMETCPMAAIRAERALVRMAPLSRGDGAHRRRDRSPQFEFGKGIRHSNRHRPDHGANGASRGVDEVELSHPVPLQQSSRRLEKEYNKWLDFLKDFSAMTFEYNVTDSYGNVTSTERAPPRHPPTV